MKECYVTLSLDDKFLDYTKHLVNSIRHFDKDREIFLLTCDDIEIPTVTSLKYKFIKTPAKPHLYINRNKPIGINKLLKEGYKIWYLDSDCIVLDDISSHFNNKEDITACIDWGWSEINKPSFTMDNFTVEGGQYLNAGVMLINDDKAFQLSSHLCAKDKHYKKAWNIRNPQLSWRKIVNDPTIRCHNLMEQDLTNWAIHKTKSSINHLDSKIYNYHGHMGDYEKLEPDTLKVLHWSGGPDAPAIKNRIEFLKDWNTDYYNYLNSIAKFEGEEI